MKTRKSKNSILDYNDEQDREKEHFIVFGLNIRYKIKFIDIVAIGSLTETVTHPREVFRLAIIRNCAAILMAHNHPSGDPGPSIQDRQLTERLVDAGDLLGIPVLDHIVVGREGKYYSFAKMGEINHKGDNK